VHVTDSIYSDSLRGQRVRTICILKRMAYTQGFLQLRALTTPLRVSPKWELRTAKPNRIVCKAQNEDVEDSDATNLSLLSRRLALGTALIGGAAAAGTKASPAGAVDIAPSVEPRISLL